MSYAAITLDGIGKEYRIGTQTQVGYRTLRESLVTTMKRPFRKSPESSKGSFWALKDISFEIEQGEITGIIGHNGAGKSTLLKLLSRITEPTTGRAVLRGRVGSLLEVGSGFHPELTGRENIYLNGAVLGMRRAEIDRKFDEIVAFSEVEKFLDTPVKHFSSGMYMRLAFAVAAHLETEILLVDEVLAVGDAGFQAKCMGKMNDVARGGRTVLLVSHSMAAINSLCNSAILLDKGRVAKIGPTDEVTRLYLAAFARGDARVDLRNRAGRHGSGEVKIVEAAAYDATGDLSTQFACGDTITFEIHTESVSASPMLHAAIVIRTLTGIAVLQLTTFDDKNGSTFSSKGHNVVRCAIPNCCLYPGEYQASFWIGPAAGQNTDFLADAITFTVTPGVLMQRGWESTWEFGVYHVPSVWNTAQQARA